MISMRPPHDLATTSTWSHYTASARLIACSTFLCEVEHYEYVSGDDTTAGPARGGQGAGYYRSADAPPPDPYEQARAILLQASAAGADFIRCAETLDGAPARFPNDSLTTP